MSFSDFIIGLVLTEANLTPLRHSIGNLVPADKWGIGVTGWQKLYGYTLIHDYLHWLLHSWYWQNYENYILNKQKVKLIETSDRKMSQLLELARKNQLETRNLTCHFKEYSDNENRWKHLKYTAYNRLTLHIVKYTLQFHKIMRCVKYS